MKAKMIPIIIAVIIFSAISSSLAQVHPPRKQVQKPVTPIPPQKGAPLRMPAKAALPNPNLIKRFQIMPTRAVLVNSLMTYQATRSALETAAKKAGMRANELIMKGLDKRPV